MFNVKPTCVKRILRPMISFVKQMNGTQINLLFLSNKLDVHNLITLSEFFTLIVCSTTAVDKDKPTGILRGSFTVLRFPGPTCHPPTEANGQPFVDPPVILPSELSVSPTAPPQHSHRRLPSQFTKAPLDLCSKETSPPPPPTPLSSSKIPPHLLDPNSRRRTPHWARALCRRDIIPDLTGESAAGPWVR